jgi:type IV pilus assembly protein PilN
MEGQLAKLKEANKDVQKLESLKTELRKKLVVVASLKKKKKGPVHILDDINTALPDRAWITQMAEKAGALMVSGVALDNQTISEFMERLSKSEYLSAVDLVESKQETKDQVKVQGFVLQSKAMYGGKSLPEGEIKSPTGQAAPAAKPAPKKATGKEEE